MWDRSLSSKISDRRVIAVGIALRWAISCKVDEEAPSAPK